MKPWTIRLILNGAPLDDATDEDKTAAAEKILQAVGRTMAEQ